MPGTTTPSGGGDEFHRPLEVILQEMNIVSDEQLDEARLRAQEDDISIVDALKELEYVADDEIQVALGQQLGMEVIDLGSVEVDLEVSSKVERMMAESFQIVPVAFDENNNTLTVAMADPRNVHALDDLRFMLNCTIKGAVSNEEDVLRKIEEVYGGAAGESFDELMNEIDDDLVEIKDDDESLDQNAISDMANAVPVVKLLNLVLMSAIRDQASDIHFEPFEDCFKIRYRIDGALLEMKNPSRSLALPLISRIKVLSNLNIAERRVPQDGKITLSFGAKKVDLRVSTLPTMFGESVVIRILDKSVISLDITRLGMSEEVMNTFMDLIHKPNGIVLVTGPTGSGKTTTLYSCLNAVNDISQKIITTEDPVEYELPGVIQVPIHSEIGTTYASCLRAILRQDPDKILVGEIRDSETGGIAIEASLTGHLVFSTLHTQDAPGTVARLVEMGIEPFLLAATIEAVVAQRLVRCICTDCKDRYNPSDEEAFEIGYKPEELEGRDFYFGRGCETCKGTGYRGRNAIYEILKMSPRLRDLVIQRKSTEVLRDAARQEGMAGLRDAGLLKVFDGITTIDEVVRETLAQD